MLSFLRRCCHDRRHHHHHHHHTHLDRCHCRQFHRYRLTLWRSHRRTERFTNSYICPAIYLTLTEYSPVQFPIVSRVFLSRIITAMLTRGVAVAIPSVCHAAVVYQNGLTYYHSFLSIGSPIILVFPREILTGQPLRGRWIQVGYKFRDFRPISGYMWETVHDRAIVTVER